MLFVVQFPFGDARAFVPDDGWRLPVPDWPAPGTNGTAQFVRHFGSAKPRHGTVPSEWIDEATYVGASHALGFASLPTIDLAESGSLRTHCAFRRVFVDETRVSCRVEVGIASDDRIKGDSDARAVLAAGRAILDLEVRVPEAAKAWSTGPLAAQGRRLARLYEFATTYRARRNNRDPHRVLEGIPTMVIELPDGQPIPPIDQAADVDPAVLGGANARFLWLQSRGGPIPVWVIQRGTATPAQMRSVRLAVLRLHATQQSVDAVLKLFSRGEIKAVRDDEPGRLSDWLNTATAALSAPKWGGIDQAALRRAAVSASAVNYVNTDEYQVRLEGIRTQVAAKVQAHVREASAVRTIQVINSPGASIEMSQDTITVNNTGSGIAIGKIKAGDITDSFKVVASSSAPEELKTALKDLHDEVKALLVTVGAVEQDGDATAATTTPAAPAGAVPADPSQATTATPAGDGAATAAAPQAQIDAADVLAALKTLSEQAIASQPAKSMMQFAATQLVEAAKKVAAHAGPIVATVSTVLRLAGIPVPF